jgi:hypothetical protein
MMEHDFTHEEEAAQDAREAERQVDEWLAAWSDDFHSDEWAEAFVDPGKALSDKFTASWSRHMRVGPAEGFRDETEVVL